MEEMMQDLHIHTIYSDGNSSLEKIYSQATENKIEIGISDHILCKTMPDKDSVLNYFDKLEKYHVLKGGEIDLGETGILDDILVSKADYIIGSIHNIKLDNQNIKFGKYFDSRDRNKKLNADFIFNDYECCKALEKILLVVTKELRQNPIDILGHCTVNPFYEQVNSKFKYEWEEEIILICASTNTAIEISGLWVAPNVDFIKKAINKGVKVTFGSDCHRTYSPRYLEYFNFVSEIINLKKGDVLKIEKR